MKLTVQIWVVFLALMLAAAGCDRPEEIPTPHPAVETETPPAGEGAPP